MWCELSSAPELTRYLHQRYFVTEESRFEPSRLRAFAASDTRRDSNLVGAVV